MMANDTTKLTGKIKKYKTALIEKAKKNGIYENFGQAEVHKLTEEFGFNKEVAEFNDWAINFDLSQLKAGE